MVLRILRLGLFGLVLAYAAAVLVMFVNQRSFIFGQDDTSELGTAGTLAIPGSTRVAIPTADGETLAGWYLPPRDKDGPVFLFLHGKSGGLENMKSRWRQIAEQGAGVLAISYRGFPGSTGAPSEDGLYEDARAAFAWLAKRHDPGKIVLHGRSLGTGVAAKLATEVKAKALILEAPYTAIVDVAGERHPYLPVSLLLWDQFRTRDFIGEVKVPLLIAHGDQDTSIPFAQAQQLFEMAPSPKKLLKMPGSDHNTLVRDGLYPHIWRFLANPQG
jgi:uncharacterized protein